MQIDNIETNRLDWGLFLLAQINKGYLKTGEELILAKEELNKKIAKPKDSNKLLAKACLANFKSINKNYKPVHYIQFIKNRLEKVNANRKYWLSITDETQDLISLLSKISFKSLS